MYLSYDPLRRLLAERNLKKADLAQAAGLSSRTVAKLFKNETVTTDTLVRICEALHCDLKEIVSLSASRECSSLQEAFDSAKELAGETDFCRIYTLSFRGQEYCFYVTRERATKAVRIECRQDGTLWWVKEPSMGEADFPYPPEERILLRPTRKQNIVSVVLISGRPGEITGLDEGVFLSSRQREEKTGIFVMSEAAFRCRFGK